MAAWDNLLVASQMKCNLLGNPLELSDAKRQQKSTRLKEKVGVSHAQSGKSSARGKEFRRRAPPACSRRGGSVTCVTKGEEASRAWASEVTCPGTNLSFLLPVTCLQVASGLALGTVCLWGMVALLPFLLQYCLFVPNSLPPPLRTCFSVTAAHVSPSTSGPFSVYFSQTR